MKISSGNSSKQMDSWKKTCENGLNLWWKWTKTRRRQLQKTNLHLIFHSCYYSCENICWVLLNFETWKLIYSKSIVSWVDEENDKNSRTETKSFLIGEAKVIPRFVCESFTVWKNDKWQNRLDETPKESASASRVSLIQITLESVPKKGKKKQENFFLHSPPLLNFHPIRRLFTFFILHFHLFLRYVYVFLFT